MFGRRNTKFQVTSLSLKTFDNLMKSGTMAFMIRIMLNQIDSQYLSRMSEDCGVIRFFAGDLLLYIEATINLRHMYSKLSSQTEADFSISELFSKADTLELEVTQTPLEAVLRVKITLESTRPEFNQTINIWKSYVYLAINPAEFPYVKITEYTEEDWFYIGPFRSRFFLADIIELMHKLLKLPNCEVKSGPCEKLDMDLCRGWCMLIKSEFANEETGADEKRNLAKLDALLKEAFVHPDNGLLEMIQNEMKKYNDELEFAKADLLTAHMELLQRYRKWLIFLYQSKTLNVDNKVISIKNGQITRFNLGGKEHFCEYVDIPYRENEILALNKNLVDEAWLLYRENL